MIVTSVLVLQYTVYLTIFSPQLHAKRVLQVVLCQTAQVFSGTAVSGPLELV
jgi:hypothetical protein